MTGTSKGAGKVIIEGLVTTLDKDDVVRIAPLGPTVESGSAGSGSAGSGSAGSNWNDLVLRPFPSSRTLANLRGTGQGVFHVTDDVELLARAAVGRIDELPPMRPAESIRGMILADTCRWYEFQVTAVDDRDARVRVSCQVVACGIQRDFVGLCRAKHAVVEAAILATRSHLLDLTHLREELARLEPLVEKTGGVMERRAFDLLRDHILADS